MIKNYKDEWQEIKDTTMTTIGKTAQIPVMKSNQN